MIIDNKITPYTNPSFYGIQKMQKLGFFSMSGQTAIKAAQDSFQQSELLQKYCTNNDVEVIFDSGTLKNCLKNLWYATLEIHKIFPKEKPTSFLRKVLNIFKPKPNEAIIIHAYGNNGTQARNKLVEFIREIKTEKDLNNRISTSGYNPVEMEKCRYCGWYKKY